MVNETLPAIVDPVLGEGFQRVAVSTYSLCCRSQTRRLILQRLTVLAFRFAEVIPQSICMRYDLWVGAKMAPVVRALLGLW